MIGEFPIFPRLVLQHLRASECVWEATFIPAAFDGFETLMTDALAVILVPPVTLRATATFGREGTLLPISETRWLARGVLIHHYWVACHCAKTPANRTGGDFEAHIAPELPDGRVERHPVYRPVCSFAAGVRRRQTRNDGVQ